MKNTPQAHQTQIWNVPIETCYKVLTDYNSYPEFVKGVDQINILSQDESKAVIEYSLNLIKKFKYTLELTHSPPTSIEWTLKESDLFKCNNGYWKLKDLGDGTTEVTYSLEVDIKGFIPKRFISSLSEKGLPAMMKSFYDRTKEVSLR